MRNQELTVQYKAHQTRMRQRTFDENAHKHRDSLPPPPATESNFHIKY